MNTETIQTITTLINTVGFPIVVCIALFWSTIKQRDSHKSEMDELTKIITSLNITIVELRDSMRELTNYIRGDSNAQH